MRRAATAGHYGAPMLGIARLARPRPLRPVRPGGPPALAPAAGAAALIAAAWWTGATWAAPPPAGPAPAAPPPKLATSKDLWGTVDICNTQAHPHVLGIRASIPGTGHRRQRMYMRFRAQFLQPDGQWVDVPGADSGARAVGSAIYRARQSGWSFTLQPSPGTSPEQLRGEVEFEWHRSNGHLLYRTQLFSTAGHPTGAAGDPPNYSAATCTMS